METWIGSGEPIGQYLLVPPQALEERERERNKREEKLIKIKEENEKKMLGERYKQGDTRSNNKEQQQQ